MRRGGLSVVCYLLSRGSSRWSLRHRPGSLSLVSRDLLLAASWRPKSAKMQFTAGGKSVDSILEHDGTVTEF